MARTEIAQQQAAVNGTLTLTPTTLDPTNGMVITQTAAGGTDVKGRLLMLRVKNTAVAAKVITIKATDRILPGGFADLAVTVGASAEVVIGPLNRNHFMRDDYMYWVDVAAAATGDIVAIWIR